MDGHGEIDESLITGETMPRSVGPGALVYAGTLNLSGPLVIEATAQRPEHAAGRDRPPDGGRRAGPRPLCAARRPRRALLRAGRAHPRSRDLLGWMLTGHGWEPALTAAIAVLIITCPCALALAVPAVQVAATSRLFCRGVLVKAPDGLERLAEVDTVVFDKTGTLTLGEQALARDSGSIRDAPGPRRRACRRQPPPLCACRGACRTKRPACR